MGGGYGSDHPFIITPAYAGVPLPIGASDQAEFPLSREWTNS